MSLSNWAENNLLDWLLATIGTSPSPPSDVYVALHKADPGEDGLQGEVQTSDDADYVRKLVTFAAANGGLTATDMMVSWLVNGSSPGYTVTHISLWDAASSGNCLFYGPLVIPRTLTANGVLTFNAGDIVTSLD